METTVVRIGNGEGLVIPASILEKLKLKLYSIVNITLQDDAIVITPAVRQGWAEAARLMRERGEDELIGADVTDDTEARYRVRGRWRI